MTQHETQKTFLKQILEDPDNLLLIYADWLEEQGHDPRDVQRIRQGGKIHNWGGTLLVGQYYTHLGILDGWFS